MQIIRENLNWLLVDFVGKDLLEKIRNICDQASNINFAEYTTAKKSIQRYLLEPDYLSVNENFEKPKDWQWLCDKFQVMVNKEIVNNELMPGDWTGLKVTSAWTVEGDNYSFHTLHDHGPEKICSLLYLNVPTKKEQHEGNVSFIMQCDGYSQLSVPRNRIVTISPQEGMLLIFPSWLIHCVYPQGPGLRKTLSVDFGPKNAMLNIENDIGLSSRTIISKLKGGSLSFI